MNDISLTRLNNESDMWPEDIVQKVKERIPKAASLNMMVKFQKKEDETGTATGSVIVNSSEKSAIIPVIIKDFMMYPLDIMIVDQRLLPLTPDYFEASFLNNNLFQKLEEYPMYAGMGRFDNYAHQLNEAIYPPNMGRYTYANGSYPILESIAQTINPSEFKTYLQENPNVLSNFHKHGNDEVVRQISKLQPVNLDEFESAARDLIPRSILMVKKMGYDNYSLLANSDEVFDPRIMKSLKRTKMVDILGKICSKPNDFINDVDRNGEKMLYPEQETGNEPYLFEHQIDEVEPCVDFACYHLKKMNGVIVEGWVVPKTINFDMEPQPMKLFIGTTMSTMQSEFAGVRIKNPNKMIHSSMPKIGQTGAFVYEKEKRALGTVPVTVLSVSESGDTIMLTCQDLNGRRINLKFSKSERGVSLERIALLGVGPGKTPTYMMPEGFKWCPMEGFHELTSSAESYHTKTAGDRLTNNPAVLINTGCGYYSVKGIDKFAHSAGFDKTNMPEYGVKFVLASLGVSPKNMEGIFKTAQVRGRAEIHGLARTPLLSEKIANKRPLAERMAKVASMLKTNMIKEASFIENNQTVDTLLSLNFVNPENLSKFIGYLPQFKTTISNLAGCLLGSRLGVQEIPEGPTSSAMYRLIDVVNGLERLRAIQEHGA